VCRICGDQSNDVVVDAYKVKSVVGRASRMLCPYHSWQFRQFQHRRHDHNDADVDLADWMSRVIERAAETAKEGIPVVRCDVRSTAPFSHGRCNRLAQVGFSGRWVCRQHRTMISRGLLRHYEFDDAGPRKATPIAVAVQQLLADEGAF
jgi:hypothetical protein